ncbi:hypothetical protein DCAR_0625743 [Daucus carota subsp. sativus]|uniref:RRM domain-containing protein n=1 Tax=Daucus carota subsp. sativus TaxID=79200 RepID=A0A161ZXW2_DAUCS|nr:PREDICTED: UBP1-associated protein 2A [Daucus carota subsp. sativus]XP_017258591.1 PREDICTED: UBP1-associated protein 2A [Daucus carota subsp. sativus]XP_017258592.1 PREDICTED: UBP1-associated protein 2A [Daucus carota subsp. sativus]WOH06318.1 hypothetical protein DCAR_0625743 [Daucus carota subsp. sativus]
MAKKRKSISTPSSSKPQLDEPQQQNSKKIPKIEEQREKEKEKQEEPAVIEEEEEEESEEEVEEEEEEEEEDEAVKTEKLNELLQPFSKDQIIEFLKIAALKDKKLLDRITEFAESDPAHRKVFVHGLGWDATSDQVFSTFSQFGEIEDCKVPTDKATGRVKGFAFILYKTRESALKALKEKQKKIGNRMTSCQLASAGPPGTNGVQDPSGRKIFVANVGAHVSPDALKLFFGKFGELEEGPLGMDPVTGKFKGFSIFVYKNADGCKKALEEPVKMFDNCRLECRLAVDGLKNNKNQNQARVLSNVAAGFGGIPQTDINSAMNYNVGVNPGFYVNPAVGLMGQNPGFGLANPMMALNQSGLATSLGVNPQTVRFSGNYGINSVSPSVIASYAAQSSLQGLGAYQSQLGSSAGSTAAVAARPQSSGLGSTGQAFPSFFGR